jgi:23S rRNA pseudouridine2605 synthase
MKTPGNKKTKGRKSRDNNPKPGKGGEERKKEYKSAGKKSFGPSKRKSAELGEIQDRKRSSDSKDYKPREDSKPYAKKPYDSSSRRRSDDTGESQDRRRSSNSKDYKPREDSKPYAKKPYDSSSRRRSDDTGESQDRRRSSDSKDYKPREDSKPYAKKPYDSSSRRRSDDTGESQDRRRSSDSKDYKPRDSKPYAKKPYDSTSRRRSDDTGESQDRRRSSDSKDYKPREDSKPYAKKPYDSSSRRRSDDTGESQDRRRSSDSKDYKPREDSKPYAKKPYDSSSRRRSDDTGESQDRRRSSDSKDYKPREDSKPYAKKPYDSSSRRRSDDTGESQDRRRSSDSKDYKPREDSYSAKKYSSKSYGKPGKGRRTAGADDGLIRLNKYIANSGICSRRDADIHIAAGVVTVNGKVVTELGYKVNPTDTITYGGERIKREKNVYLLLNKPKDYITTMDDPNNRKTVMELISNACKERIYPVGRLDRNTTGLLLFTNDGDLATKLTHPKSGIKKIYYVETDKAFKKSDIEKLLNGVELEDGLAQADQANYVGESKKEIGIELHSGKYRIVRRMIEHLGYEVVKLDRVMFAGLTKKELPRGRWRFLTEKEISFLKMLS